MSLKYVDELSLAENIVKTKEHVESVRAALDSAKQNIIEYATIPSPSADVLGLFVIYTGATNSTYTHGYVYECVSDGAEPATYSWVQRNVQDGVAVDGETIVKDASTDEISAVTATQNTLGVVKGGDGTSINANGGVDVIDRLVVTDTMPTASVSLLSETRLFIGTTGTYEKGGIYQCQLVPESDPAEYEWVLISTAGVDLSQYKKIFSGTSAEWDALPLEDKITYDYTMPDDDGETGDITDVVESGNHNPVESDAVFDSEQTIFEVMGEMGAKNLIPFDLASIKAKNSSGYPSGSWNNNEWTINGVTFAIQDDNTVVATGANTSNSNAQLDYYITIKGGVPYIANGCPSGGSDTTYRIANYCSTSPAETFVDNGNGVSITRAADTAIIVHMQVRAGYTIDGQLVFKPMIRLASDTDNTYQPYAKINKQLTAENEALTNQANDMVNVLGAKNLIPFPYYNTSKIQDGITWTVNSDGSISASGTATANSFFRITQDSDLSRYNNTILSGCPANGEMWSKWALYLTGNKDGQSIVKIDEGSGVLIEDIPSGYSGGLYAKVINGQTVNFTFKPMVRLASIKDDTYEPYSMTNREMTPYVQAISNPNLLDDPWFTVNQRGLSTYSNVNYSYTVDRWLGSSGFDLYVDSDGVSVSSGNKSIFERFEDSLYNFLVGKTVTLSALKSNGSIVSVSGVVKSNGNSFAYEGDSDVSLYLTKDSFANFVQVAFKNTTVKLRAVKLELGSVSTLAQDTAPNYATELLKCQRYFVRFLKQNNSTSPIAYGATENDNSLRAALPLPTKLRAESPTISVSDLTKTRIYCNNNSYTPTNIAQYKCMGHMLNIKIDATSLPSYHAGAFMFGASGEYLDVSADL